MSTGEAASGGTGSTTGTLRKGRTERLTVLLGPEGDLAWELSEWRLCARVVASASVTCCGFRAHERPGALPGGMRGGGSV